MTFKSGYERLLADLLADAITELAELRKERDTLRAQLFEAREQRDEARAAPRDVTVPAGLVPLTFVAQWQGCLDQANKNAAEARDQVSQLTNELEQLRAAIRALYGRL